MKYLRKLPEDSLDEWLRSRRQILHTRKVNPAKVGASSVIIKCQTAGVIWSGLLPQSPQSPSLGTKVLRVTATGANMSSVYASSFAHIWVNSSSGARYTPADYLTAVKAGQIGFQLNAYDDYPATVNLRKKQWIFTISGTKTNTVFFKPFVRCADDVAITVEELN